MSLHHKQILEGVIFCGLFFLLHAAIRLVQTAEKTEYFLKEEREKRQ